MTTEEAADLKARSDTVRHWCEKFPKVGTGLLRDRTFAPFVQSRFGKLRMTEAEHRVLLEIRTFLRGMLDDMMEDLRAHQSS